MTVSRRFFLGAVVAVAVTPALVAFRPPSMFDRLIASIDRLILALRPA